MERIYECPICGKEYKSLQEMINCATTCDKKREQQTLKAKETMQRIDELSNQLAAQIKILNQAITDGAEDVERVQFTLKKITTQNQEKQEKKKEEPKRCSCGGKCQYDEKTILDLQNLIRKKIREKKLQDKDILEIFTELQQDDDINKYFFF